MQLYPDKDPNGFTKQKRKSAQIEDSSFKPVGIVSATNAATARANEQRDRKVCVAWKTFLCARSPSPDIQKHTIGARKTCKGRH
jgi:hypothetical protein